MRKINNKQRNILLSVTALVLIAVLAAGFTYSWAEGGNRGYVKGNDIVISAGSNLTMRQDGKTTNSITIPTCTLEEVSSADGRNYFFPMADNTTSKTDTMTFREGVATDANSRYVSVDFELEAGDSATEVYLGAGTIVQCDNAEVMDALRMSFSLNDGSEPIVFKPNQMPGVSMKYYPITTITTAGVPTTAETSTSAYGDYYYKGANESKPIFELEKGETLNVTLSIWLEGTVFDGNDIANSNLSVYVDFSTTVDDLIKYNFVDNCHNRGDAKANNWVSNNMELDSVEYETMMYIFDNTSQRYYAMEKTSDTTWEAYIPVDINNFYFRRYSIDIDEWWNEWEPTMVDIPTIVNSETNTSERTFVAIAGQVESEGTNLDGCYGYWKDEADTIRVYFQLETDWDKTKCYAWRSDGTYATKVWPGSEMTYSHNNGDDKPVYYIDLTGASKIAGIQFNNSNDTQQYEITDSQYFFNGFATWYKSSTENGKWTYINETDSLIYPVNDPTP